MQEITSTLQALCFGDRNTFIFHETDEERVYGVISKVEITKLLFDLEQRGYAITNPRELLRYSICGFERFKNELNALLNANTKEGITLRKTFASEEELHPYTSEEWNAILAQYAITYGWAEDFEQHFNASAEAVLDTYVDTLDLTTINNIDNGKIKKFTVGNETTLVKILHNILESKTVLRAQQLATLNNAPIKLVSLAAESAHITIKEILINAAVLLLNENLNFPLLRTPTDVVRFVAAHLTKGDSFEGQLTKAELAKIKLHIPTSMRKMLLRNMELIATTNGNHSKGTRYICEDMIKFENFWKRLDKFLCYEPAKNKRRKYPHYTNAIDLLYSGDRSWTFNSRYEEAKKRGDYLTAITVMTEKPTLLLRNLLEFMRMTTGTEFPQKEIGGVGVSMRKPKNAFTEALKDTKTKSTDKETVINTVITDATQYLTSSAFIELLTEKANRKVLWQILEQLIDESIYTPRFTREVQGQTVNYIIPIPAINKTLAENIKHIILNVLRQKTDSKKVYINDTATGYKLQYSGRNSTEISFAGEFVTPGTELSLSALMEGKDIKNPLLRLGVMWRGSNSMDIDHSCITSNDKVVYYGSPELYHKSELLISSSGDITTCGKDKFSTELIDIDITKIDYNYMEELFNNFIVFSGGAAIGDSECYTFFSIIDKKDRVMNGQKVHLDLAKQDYAIRIDPENTDKTGSYIGCSINFRDGFIKVHALPVKGPGGKYSNAHVEKDEMSNLINNAASAKGITIDYAFKKVFETVETPDEADIILTKLNCHDDWIGTDKIILHPGRDSELINQLLF